ncbi:MAG TPA: dephospho-CoA kinase [Paludibacter sp.]|nr:dephospho-CoA kinase [Paludibacter sp.]
MSKPMVIGITGGIGGGKSTLAARLRDEGFEVYDSDMEARRLQNEHPVIREQLIELFGEDIYTEQGLNRTAIAGMVFTNKDLLLKLNKVVHPVVEAHFRNWVDKNSENKFLFVESAILFESGFDKFVDKVIVITASEEVRIRRVIKRDGSTVEQVLARMSSQISEDFKTSKADFIIHSDDNMPLLDKMRRILQELKEKY